jgi:hypothetical protein
VFEGTQDERTQLELTVWNQRKNNRTAVTVRRATVLPLSSAAVRARLELASPQLPLNSRQAGPTKPTVMLYDDIIILKSMDRPPRHEGNLSRLSPQSRHALHRRQQIFAKLLYSFSCEIAQLEGVHTLADTIVGLVTRQAC